MEVSGKLHGRAASRQEQTPVSVTWEATCVPRVGLGISETRKISYYWRELNQRIVQLVLHYHNSEQQVKLKSCFINEYILICT